MALTTVAVVAAFVGVIEIAMLLGSGLSQAWVAVLFLVVGLIYAGSGLLAWWRRPSNRIGVVLVAGGVAWFAAGLVNTGIPVLMAVGTIGATVPLAIVVHLLHAFPSGRLQSRASLVTVAAAYFVALVLQVPRYLFVAAPAPTDVLSVASQPNLVRLGIDVQQAAGAAVVITTAAILIPRLSRSDMALRRGLPLLAYGIFAVLFLPFSSDILQSLLGASRRHGPFCS